MAGSDLYRYQVSFRDDGPHLDEKVGQTSGNLVLDADLRPWVQTPIEPEWARSFRVVNDNRLS